MRVSIQESKSNLAEDAGAPQSNHAGVMRLLATGAAVWRGGKPKGALLVLPDQASQFQRSCWKTVGSAKWKASSMFGDSGGGVNYMHCHRNSSAVISKSVN